jgi:hypothetical protein
MSALRVTLLAALFGCAVLRAAESAPSSALVTPVKTKIGRDELFELGFDRLSAFRFTIVDAGTGATPAQIAEAQKRDQVPSWIHFYEGRRVVLTGYMMPLEIANGRSTKFIMMKDIATCCYGAVPSMNDYVIVTMKGEGVAAVQDVPSDMIGVFHVEQKYDSGYVTSLFTMDGEKFLGPRK